MKKELIAALIILGLLVGSIVNLWYLKGLVDEISFHLAKATQACIAEDSVSADQEVNNALQIWLNADDYTHIFIRHSEIDAASDIFYDILSAINSNEHSSAQATIEQLTYHLNSIYTMELVTIRSVF